MDDDSADDKKVISLLPYIHNDNANSDPVMILAGELMRAVVNTKGIKPRDQLCSLLLVLRAIGSLLEYEFGPDTVSTLRMEAHEKSKTYVFVMGNEFASSTDRDNVVPIRRKDEDD